VVNGEATNTNLIVWIDPIVLETTIYRTWGEHGKHYTTDAVVDIIERYYISSNTDRQIFEILVITNILRRIWRYQRCNQNPQIEEGHTAQCLYY